MATKYNPEKDYADYLELARQLEELDSRIAALVEERRTFKEGMDRHVEAARGAINFEIIKTAAHEFQVEILNEITMAVIEANDLEKAVKLIDHLETHLEARLRLSGKRETTLDKSTPPTVSPAIAAKKRIEAEQPIKSQSQSSTDGKTPSPPPSTKGGRIVERRTLTNENVNEICRYEYDGGRLTRMLFLDANGSPVRTHQLIYDKEGRLMQEIHIDRAGITLQVCDRKMDGEGKILQETVSNAHNEVLHTIEFKYDRHGRLVKKQWRDAHERKTKAWDYKYDKDSKEPSKITWLDERNKPYGFVELRYDDKGHILEEISKDRSGEPIRSIKYQYFYG